MAESSGGAVADPGEARDRQSALRERRARRDRIEGREISASDAVQSAAGRPRRILHTRSEQAAEATKDWSREGVHESSKWTGRLTGPSIWWRSSPRTSLRICMPRSVDDDAERAEAFGRCSRRRLQAKRRRSGSSTSIPVREAEMAASRHRERARNRAWSGAETCGFSIHIAFSRRRLSQTTIAGFSCQGRFPDDQALGLFDCRSREPGDRVTGVGVAATPRAGEPGQRCAWRGAADDEGTTAKDAGETQSDVAARG